MPHNALVRLQTYVKQAEASPRIAQSITQMDRGIHLIVDRDYISNNEAVAAVQAPLVAALRVILVLIALVMVWGGLVPIESAAMAQGKVVLLSNKKTIQHLEGGVIKEILVKEGDPVIQGQPLIRLNDTAAAASRDVLQGQLYVARAGEARLIAERDGLKDIPFDPDMVKEAEKNEAVAKIFAAQQRMFDSEQQSHKAKLAILDQRIAEAREEIVGLKSQSSSASDQVKSLKAEIATVRRLLAQGYETKPRLYALQRRQSELAGSRGQYDAQIAKAQQTIAETQMQILDQQKEFENKNSEDLRDAQSQVADLQDKLRAAQDVVDRTVITAPAGGIVTGLRYHTSGGVIAPATPIMDIVPQDDQLIIEARLKPADISNVHPGLDARILFTSYKMRNTPKVPGKVTQVSADAFTDEHNPQLASYYTAQIEVDKEFIRQMAQPVELYPGMPAQIMVRTGSRSFLGYLFSPITDSMRSAFREK